MKAKIEFWLLPPPVVSVKSGFQGCRMVGTNCAVHRTLPAWDRIAYAACRSKGGWMLKVQHNLGALFATI